MNGYEVVFVYLTDPTDSDNTDSDGFSDFDEVESGTDPLNASDFPILEPPSTPSYFGLILGIVGGVFVVTVTIFVLYKKGVFKGSKKVKKPKNKKSS